MAPSEYAWGAVKKFRIRGCRHCRGRNSAFDVKANSKRRSELACRRGLRCQQLLHRGVRDSGSTLRLFGENLERVIGYLTKQQWKTRKEKANLHIRSSSRARNSIGIQAQPQAIRRHSGNRDFESGSRSWRTFRRADEHCHGAAPPQICLELRGCFSCSMVHCVLSFLPAACVV